MNRQRIITAAITGGQGDIPKLTITPSQAATQYDKGTAMIQFTREEWAAGLGLKVVFLTGGKVAGTYDLGLENRIEITQALSNYTSLDVYCWYYDGVGDEETTAGSNKASLSFSTSVTPVDYLPPEPSKTLVETINDTAAKGFATARYDSKESSIIFGNIKNKDVLKLPIPAGGGSGGGVTTCPYEGEEGIDVSGLTDRIIVLERAKADLEQLIISSMPQILIAPDEATARELGLANPQNLYIVEEGE